MKRLIAALWLICVAAAYGEIPDSPDYSLRWSGYTGVSVIDSYLVCATHSGLVVLERKAGPTLAYEMVNNLPLTTSLVSQKLSYPWLLVHTGADQICLVDVSDLPNIAVVATYDIAFPFEDYELRDSSLYVSMGFDGLLRYRLHGMTDAEYLDSSIVGINYTQLERKGDTLYALDTYNGVLRYLLSDTAAPAFLDYLYVPFQVHSFTIEDSTIVLLTHNSRFLVANAAVTPPVIVDSFQTITQPTCLFALGNLVIMFDTLVETIEVIDRSTGRDIFVTVDDLPANPGIGEAYTAETLDYLIYPSTMGNLLAIDLQSLYFGPIAPLQLVEQRGALAGLALHNDKLFYGGPFNPLEMQQLATDGEPLNRTTLYSGLTDVSGMEQQGDSLLVLYPQIRRSLTLEVQADTNIFRGTLFVDTSRYHMLRLNPNKIDSMRSYFLIGDTRVDIYTISDSGEISLINYINTVGKITDVELVDSLIAVTSTKFVRFYRLYNNFAVEYRSQFKTELEITETRAHMHRLMVFEGGNLQMVNVSSPTNPVIDTTIRLDRRVYATDTDNAMMYASTNRDIAVFDISSPTPRLLDAGGIGGYFITAENGIAAVSDSFSIMLYDLRSIQTDVEEEQSTVPRQFALAQNYPNPFNPTTTISYTLPRRANVILEVFNLLGQRVATLVNGEQSAGDHRVEFDASGGTSGRLASGLYFYRLEAGEIRETRKMLLVK
ncbi:MAG: T9SS type A sorting domain-containing protein [bacterium]|nr:T9SS type A sorting domain-containing protein [bacterium]